MRIEGSSAVVTGANRGIGHALVRRLLEHGAAKVYAGVRDPSSMPEEAGVVPLRRDVTEGDQVAAAAATAGDVTIVISNAGVNSWTPPLDGDFDEAARPWTSTTSEPGPFRRHLPPCWPETAVRALVNILSVGSWRGTTVVPGYAASKAAPWSLADSLRQGLSRQGTVVMGVHAGFVDIESSAWAADAPKISPVDPAEQTMQAPTDNRLEALAGETTRLAKAALAQPVVPA